MPNLEWNKMWEKRLNEFLKKNPKKEKYFGERWGNPETTQTLKKICENFVIPYINKNHIMILWVQKILEQLYLF